MHKLEFAIIPGSFSIHRLSLDSQIPVEINIASFYSVTKTDDELSIVVPDDIDIESDKCEKNWKSLKIMGPLDFNLTGVLAGITNVLAEAGISIFAVSTFDTDYILVKNEKLDAAVSVLKNAGHILKL